MCVKQITDRTSRQPSSGLNFNQPMSGRRDGKMEAGEQKEGADERMRDRRVEGRRGKMKGSAQ